MCPAKARKQPVKELIEKTILWKCMRTIAPPRLGFGLELGLVLGLGQLP